MAMVEKKGVQWSQVAMHIALACFSFICIYPFVLTLSVSFTSEKAIISNGYQLIPSEFSLRAYELIFKDNTIYNAYGVTIFITVVGTAISLLLCSMAGYGMSLSRVRYRNTFAMYFYIPTVFSAGLLPWYLVCTQLLNLKDSILALILPSLVSTFNIFLFRNNFKSIPSALSESAEIDGAGPFRTFFQIILPLSTPVLATIMLFTALGYWNDWTNALWFINDNKLFPLQYMLYRIKSTLDMIIQSGSFSGTDVPTQSYQVAMLFVTIGPIILVYPFVQRYFVKGLIVGSVKG